MEDAVIYRLITRQLAGEATVAERTKLTAWRQVAPENEVRYRMIARLIALAGRVPELVDAGAPPLAAELISDHRARQPRSADSIPLTPARSRRPRSRFWLAPAAVAASLAVGIGVAILSQSVPGAEGLRVEDVVTHGLETTTVELPDGSVVTVAPDSRLTVLSADGRDVALDGRAYFAVAKREDARSFRIATAAGEVTVLGTRFDLKARATDARVVVIEGRVALSTADARSEASAGQMARMTADGSTSVVPVDDPEPFTRWTGRLLVFQSTPMADAAREIERAYDVHVEMEGPELHQRVVTAWFADRSLQEVVYIVCLAVDARCTVRGDTVSMAVGRKAVR